MQGRPGAGDLWGKFRDESRGGPAWHPLIDHCTDVACVLKALLHQPTIRRRLARAGGVDDLDGVQVARLCFLAYLHDLGKCNWGFQKKIALDFKAGAGHVREAAPLFLEPALIEQLVEAINFDRMVSWFSSEEPCLRLLLAAISHHKAPLQYDSGGYAREALTAHGALWKPKYGIDPLAGVRSLAGAARRCFPQADEPGAAHLPSNPEFQHAFVGLLMLGDWLGSDETLFRYREPGEGARIERACAWARDAVRVVGLAVEPEQRGIGAKPRSARELFEFDQASAMQARLAEIGRELAPVLTLVESETGSGKTEAALLYFKELFAAKRVDGLYFALPTRAAASQIHRRVTRFVERLFPATVRPSVVQAVPGFIRADEAAGRRQLPDFSVLWEDDPDERQRQTRWAAEHPKRYMAGQIVVGTIDQVLLSNLQVPYAQLRSSALMRHLLVIDEVHASDAYMTALLRSVLQVHFQSGGYALLMSATLGGAARHELLCGRGTPAPDLANCRSAPYPAITWLHHGAVNAHRVAGAPIDKNVRFELRPWLSSAEAIAQAAQDAACLGAKVLVVRNTVDDARAAFAAVEATGGAVWLLAVNGVRTLHHARFAQEDRAALDRAVEERVGRERPEGGVIVIGTQTLEQSLDIDTDLLITDLCPMDVLLQRVGRLHRHPRRDRPPDFREPRCVLLTPAERDLSPFLTHRRHGVGSVYPDVRAIEATWRLLMENAFVAIPAMNRELVECATHPDALSAIADSFGEDWRRHADDLFGEEFAARGIESLHRLPRHEPFGRFTLAGLEERVTTRLGADDRLLAFGEPHPTGPFGQRITTLRAPAHLLPKAAASDAEIEGLTVDRHGLTFTFNGRPFRYDRLGLSRLPKER